MPHPPEPARPPVTQSVCRELENEGWLWRVILEFFRSRPEIDALLSLVDRCLVSRQWPLAAGDPPGGDDPGLQGQ